jgi:nicotinamidase-related amidase
MSTYVSEFTHTFDLSPATTALLVVDMQNATGNPEMGLGRMLRAQGRLDEAAYRFNRIATVIVPNVQRLLAAFRRLQAPVFFITYGGETADCSDVPRHIRGIVQATRNHVGQPEHDIMDALKPLPGEPVLNKVTMGAFASTGIEARLRALGVSEVVVTGVSTNNCVGMTAMEASDRAFGAVLVSDATGTCSDRMQMNFEEHFTRLWGRVLTAEQVIAELKAHAHGLAAQ